MRFEQLWPTPVAFGHIPVNEQLRVDVTSMAVEFNKNRHEAIEKAKGASELVRFKRRNLLDMEVTSVNNFTEVAIDYFRDYLRNAVGDSRAYEIDLQVRGVAKSYEYGTRILPHFDAECDFVMLYYLTDSYGDETRKTKEHLGESGLILVDPRGYRTVASPMQETVKYFKPNAGDFIIYPSYLMHETDPNLTNCGRPLLALSFNLVNPLPVPKKIFEGVRIGEVS
jgi:hypothetical protein